MPEQNDVRASTVQATLQWVIGLLVAFNAAATGYILRQLERNQDSTVSAIERIDGRVTDMDKRVVAIESSRFTSKDGYDMAKLLVTVTHRLEDLEKRTGILNPN